METEGIEIYWNSVSKLLKVKPIEEDTNMWVNIQECGRSEQAVQALYLFPGG